MSVTGVVSGRVVTVAIGSGPLATVGGMAIAQTGIGNYLITRTAASSATVLSATCTHEGCTVSRLLGIAVRVSLPWIHLRDFGKRRAPRESGVADVCRAGQRRHVDVYGIAHLG